MPKEDILRLAYAFEWTETWVRAMRNRYSTDGLLDVWVVLRRFCTPCRWEDLQYSFCKHTYQLPEIFWASLELRCLCAENARHDDVLRDEDRACNLLGRHKGSRETEQWGASKIAHGLWLTAHFWAYLTERFWSCEECIVRLRSHLVKSLENKAHIRLHIHSNVIPYLSEKAWHYQIYDDIAMVLIIMREV